MRRERAPFGHRFIIRDCTGKVVGNPSGYVAHHVAESQASVPGRPAYRAIWQAYENRPDKSDNFLHSIKLERI